MAKPTINYQTEVCAFWIGGLCEAQINYIDEQTGDGVLWIESLVNIETGETMPEPVWEQYRDELMETVYNHFNKEVYEYQYRD